jgi:hypothetical protein
MRTRISLATMVATILALTLSATVAGAFGGHTIHVPLSSAVEVPTPNDAATGEATLVVNPGHRTVCFEISWDDVAGTVVAAHIHRAPANVAGPVVVPLFLTAQTSDANGDGSASGCFTVDLHPRALAHIIANPDEYYVNVHSSQNPPGAIRGQLD